MTERPCLMCGEMVCATLADRKTNTRRVVKPQPNARTDFVEWNTANEAFVPWRNAFGNGFDRTGPVMLCPFGVVGDRLWVRENIRIEGERTRYAADDSPARWNQHHVTATRLAEWSRREINKGDHTIPSILMPRFLSRLTLEITGVRVERVQQITDEDCAAEGLTDHEGHYWSEPGATLALTDKGRAMLRGGFRVLWDSLNAPRGYDWDANPYVWAISFKRVSPLSDPPSDPGGA